MARLVYAGKGSTTLARQKEREVVLYPMTISYIEFVDKNVTKFVFHIRVHETADRDIVTSMRMEETNQKSG